MSATRTTAPVASNLSRPAFFMTLAPHRGQVLADSETELPHSRQLTSAMHPPGIYELVFMRIKV